MQWLKLPAWKVKDRVFVPGIQVSMEQFSSSPLTRKDLILWGASVIEKEAWPVSDHQGSNFETRDWGAVSPHSSHHSHEVLQAQFSLYVRKGGLEPFYLIVFVRRKYN